MTNNKEQKDAKMKVEISVYVGIGRHNKGHFHCFGGKYAIKEEKGQINGSGGYEVAKIGNYAIALDEDINIDALADKYRADIVKNEKQRLLDSLAALEAESAQELEA